MQLLFFVIDPNKFILEIITGIQQVGIGVADADEAKHLYKDLFGMNVLIFDDQATATLMTAYTGSRAEQRRALLTINMRGGGGFEIWQFTSRKPSVPPSRPKAGDTGIFAIKIKTPDAEKAYRHFSGFSGIEVSPVKKNSEGMAYFWLTDPYGNLFQIIQAGDWFQHNSNICGGVCGAVIGVSNMDRALGFYRSVLGISHTVREYTGPAGDIPGEENGTAFFHRVVLRKPTGRCGAFSKLLGSVEIELIQCISRKPDKIFHNRYWGDCGFIHLCFDVLQMCTLKETAAAAGYYFTVDSADSFTMGDSAGRFCYVEDPDGTLIELVETHKVPILKKAGWYINLRKRKNQQPLPDWMIRLLALKKVS